MVGPDVATWSTFFHMERLLRSSHASHVDGNTGASRSEMAGDIATLIWLILSLLMFQALARTDLRALSLKS